MRGGEDEIMLLECSCMAGMFASWSSSSEAEGASNIGESCRDGYEASIVCGRSSTGDDCEIALCCPQPV